MSNMSVRVDEEWLDKARDSVVSAARMFTSESYYRSFWDLAEHGVVLLDKNKNIIEANPYFVQMLGLSLASIQGKHISEIVSTQYWRTDNINLNTLIKGISYSYCNDEEIMGMEGRGNTIIPVRVIVTRVPSTLTEEFQHFIVQIYKIEKAAHIDGQPFVNKYEQSYGNIFKSLLMQPWFVQTALWIIFILIVVLSISGNLMPIIEKFFH